MRQLPRVYMGEAAEMTGLSHRELLELLAQRERFVTAMGFAEDSHIPQPAAVVDGEPCWSRRSWMAWVLGTGRYLPGHDGRPVIGYAGVADLLGVQYRTVETRLVRQRRSAPRSGDIPQPFRVLTVPVFYRDEIVAWAVQIGYLLPDGSRNPRKPHRGAPL